MRIDNKIIKNTIYNFGGYFWTALVSIFLTPYIVSKLGIEKFAVWSIVFAVTGYFGLLDFGVRKSFMRFIANASARKDTEEINKIISTGFFFYFFFAVILTALAFIFAKPIIRTLKIPTLIQGEAVFTLIGALAIFSFLNSLEVFSAFISGLQRMDITSLIAIFMTFPNILGTIIVLELGYGLRGLIVNYGLIMLLSAAISFWVAHRLWAGLKLGFSEISSATFKELFSYGIKIQVTNLSGLVNMQTDKILLAYFINLPVVAFYELGAKVTMMMRSFPMLLFSAVLPTASELEAKSDYARLYKLYNLGSKCLSFTVIPLGLFMISTAEVIIFLWMGKGFEISALVIRVLTLGCFINLLTGIATSTARGIGRVDYEMKASIIIVVLNIILSIILIQKFGLIGALIATAFSVTVGSIYYMLKFHKYILEILFTNFMVKMYLKPFSFSFTLGILVYLFNSIAQGIFTFSSRIDYLILLVMDTVIFFTVYLFAILKCHYFKEEELKTLLGGVKLLFGRGENG